MATSAERQKRYREHKKGNHALCVPGNCPERTPDTSLASDRPPVLGPSGATLWEQASESYTLDPLARVMLLEACRIVDRLDQIDEQLAGRPLLTVENTDGGTIDLVVDRALAEARQQATALKNLAADIRPKPKTGRPSNHEKERKQEVKGIADLTARIRERREQA